MKIKTTNWLSFALIVLCCSLMPKSIKAQNPEIKKDTVFIKMDSLNRVDTIVYTPTRATYYVDGKQVPERIFNEMGLKGKLIVSGPGTGNQRDAIKMFGEKYRYGVFFFDSIKE
jgi:hypothetical protein